MNQKKDARRNVIVAGGGIGGLAASLALARRGVQVLLLEQAEQIAEIGAGIQLGANAFNALDALGVGEAARGRAVFTDWIKLMDAVDAHEIVRIETGPRYRERFGNPYAVIHRADIHLSILEAVKQNPLIQFRTSTQITGFVQDERGVTVTDQRGEQYRADAVIGCDGVKSAVRAALIGDEARVTGHVVYRAVVDVENMPTDLQINAPVVWAGPHCHLVHYPLRGGRQYNLVVTFHSREKEQWGVRDGSKEEVLSYFDGIHSLPHQMLDRPTSWRRWATADRDPVERWSFGRATILGDAAHPMTQYLAQGACQALEDAVTLGAAYDAADGDFEAAFALYEKARIPRTARVLYSAREMGRVYHAKGVERLVRNSLWVGRTQEQFYDSLQWLYGWRAEDALNGVA
ncbi:3-hydroxybenzoate 6-monooxygenase [Paraburkholderia caballeronis]|uniref:3-hydroxybenzoate 6-hydroxylase n=1 Tax=Paraburkholderia caballeronis TaxID=416943 RepID=A0A1H7HN65_9BURK|nr:3-hydroxybenzoate 6-monooxygenase [Paraburkholderia caballeronis]PXW29462.1 3-hydroxybenzoate 6-hydroxylase [Paraburkholderia caballeronis]PXX04721.1 3-hydroxybenzoate 6-hydroxylase [Paraburkholderia caballeronis]RAK05782.1 3-hydroxybenzoate 6-hydroxylase [Paraburkholderia caballeronis]TDV18561.1 3-hydroxybenzoate 6-hydroxylase [Paraburkholderia caballeronis]TDV19901.1 3-hydroxybenzoate 6-hydroxylase [Paraburkholderia caballeronis]